MMKNSIIVMTLAILISGGCGNNRSKEPTHDQNEVHDHLEGTHQHEDGSIHQNHQDSIHQQEEFKVESDSTSLKKEKHEHNHEEGSHQH